MQKLFSLALIATTAMLAGTVQADEGGVTLSGRLVVAGEYVKAGEATNGTASSSQKRLSNDTSYIRFRGTENLGASGLKALWQVESGIPQDGSAPTAWASRNSGVGLEGQFGTLIAGQWDMPYKNISNGPDLDIFMSLGMETFQTIIGNGSRTSGADNNFAFDRRQRNVIQYWSPNLSGFSTRLAAGTGEDATNRGRILSGAVMYRNGPYYLSAAHEVHKNYQSSGKDDKGTRVAGSVKFGPVTVNAIGERLQYEPVTGDIKRNAWSLGTIYEIGAGSLRAQYAKANNGTGSSAPGCATPGQCKVGNVSNLADSGAKQWTILGTYGFSKRTTLYTYYTKIDNEKNGTYNFDINNFNPNPNALPGTNSTLAGSDRSGFSLGILHYF
ncbi:MAG: porin [Burkholderiales bacterium]